MRQQIVAMGGGGFSGGCEPLLLERFILSLTGAGPVIITLSANGRWFQVMPPMTVSGCISSVLRFSRLSAKGRRRTPMPSHWTETKFASSDWKRLFLDEWPQAHAVAA
jgi:hypothetical protein